MARLQPGERKACEACGKEMIGALTVKGNTAPIELEPAPAGQGNIWLGKNSVGTVICASLSQALVAEANAVGLVLRVNHFATCPERERFGRG